jgi:phosphoglycerate dehydrogenase-like enzyme
MKRGAVLVNTARGALVDEHAVKELVCSGHLTSYATDVVEGTRTAPGHHLVGVDRIIVTPHISAYTSHSLTGMGESVVSALERWYGQDLLPETLANPAVVEVIQRTRNQ